MKRWLRQILHYLGLLVNSANLSFFLRGRKHLVARGCGFFFASTRKHLIVVFILERRCRFILWRRRMLWKGIQVAYKRKGNPKEVAGFLVNLKSSSSWHMTSLTSDLVTFQSYKSLKDESKSPNLQTTNTIRSFLPKPNELRRHPDARFFSRLLVLVMNRSCKKWVGASDWLADLAAERGDQ